MLNVKQDHKFSDAEVEWLRERGHINEIEENRRLYPAEPKPAKAVEPEPEPQPQPALASKPKQHRRTK